MICVSPAAAQAFVMPKKVSSQATLNKSQVTLRRAELRQQTSAPADFRGADPTCFVSIAPQLSAS
jgi:hypothetical protein